jgi:pyruvate dehydrogenase E1 component alpha subunit
MPIKNIANFNISYMGILDEKGNLDKELEPKLSNEQLVRLYRGMMLAREQDQRMLKLQRQGRIGTFGPCTGQEASTCGPALAMGEKDWLVTAFRELGARLMRGEPLINSLLFHNGYEEGNIIPSEKRILPINIIVGSQTMHATGIAYAMKYKKEKDSAVVVFFGDGGSSQGEVYEAMNFAAVWKAPVVFICQNNQWAISVPRKKQTNSRTIAQKAIAFDMPAIQVDGNDPLAMYKAAQDALDRAHAGEGPSFIEAVTYRLMMHTTSDDPTKYRTEEEVAEWWKKEPLSRFKMYLENKGIWSADSQKKLEEEVKAEVEGAVKDFEARKDFKPDSPFDFVYGSKVEEIEEQRKEFLENLKSEAKNG